jgi:hypothetical protein
LGLQTYRPHLIFFLCGHRLPIILVLEEEQLMKNIVSFFATCLILALLAGCGGNGNHRVFGKLTGVSGTVRLFGAAGGAWAPAQNGAAVGIGDSVQTSEKSEAVVAFGNSTVKLSENTCITISDTLDAEKKRLVSVLVTGGEVLCDVKDYEKSGGRFEVWTPTAVAHAEGTHFSVTFSPQAYSTNVHVLDGRVRVYNPFMPSAPQVMVSPGCFTTVAYNAGPSATAPMNYGQFKKMERVLGPRWYHDYGVRFNVDPDQMPLDAPIVVVPVITAPLFFPPVPPLPRGPHGRFVVQGPFLLPPGPGMPLPERRSVAFAASGFPAPGMPPMPSMPRHGGVLVPPAPPGPGRLPAPPGSGRMPSPPMPGHVHMVAPRPVAPLAPHAPIMAKVAVHGGNGGHQGGNHDHEKHKGDKH